MTLQPRVAEFAKNFGAETVAFRSAKDALDHTFAERKATMPIASPLTLAEILGEFRYGETVTVSK